MSGKDASRGADQAAARSSSSSSTTSTTSTTSTKTIKKNDGCALHELVQYHCQIQGDRVMCQPVERILQRCAGRPSVDVTHIVETDRMGNLYVPEQALHTLPPPKYWHDLK